MAIYRLWQKYVYLTNFLTQYELGANDICLVNCQVPGLIVQNAISVVPVSPTSQPTKQVSLWNRPICKISVKDLVANRANHSLINDNQTDVKLFVNFLHYIV